MELVQRDDGGILVFDNALPDEDNVQFWLDVIDESGTTIRSLEGSATPETDPCGFCRTVALATSAEADVLVAD
jgi:hypothetical protein